MSARRHAPEPPVLNLTTIGRVSGQPRTIEIWFVASSGRFYLFAESFRRANWVRNIERNPNVRVELGGRELAATARVLDRDRDSDTWRAVQGLARAKYGWGDGLPVEITPDRRPAWP